MLPLLLLLHARSVDQCVGTFDDDAIAGAQAGQNFDLISLGGADVEIRSGIAAGDRVIVGGPEALADGIAIEEIRP